jgi:cell wall assembly regulator SMI1
MSITQYFYRIIQKQEEIGYDYARFLNAPATKKDIHDAERELGFPLNDELKELYGVANGLNTDLNEVMPSGKIDLIPLQSFANLQCAIRDSKEYLDFAEEMLSKHLGAAPNQKMLLFLYDGAHTQYWVDLNNGSQDYGKVWLIQGYGDPCGIVFQSVTSMFEAICYCYESGLFSVTSDGYLDSDDRVYSVMHQIMS